MKLDLFVEESTSTAPVVLLVMARIANMVLGLAVIPVLIRYLGGDGFAAWAILLAISAAFSLLEVGMAPTFVKHVAPALQQGEGRLVGQVLNHVLLILLVCFGLGAAPVFWFAEPMAQLLHLPDAGLMSARQMVIFVFVAVALRSLLQFGSLTFNAARRFRALAVASFLQSSLSNCAAAVVAIATRRLDLALLAFWIAQLLVLAGTFAIAGSIYIRTMVLEAPQSARLKSLLGHGLKVQVYDWVQIVTFQFDKLLVSGLMGLWAVAPYEVAYRSVLALRSVPVSGMESFLATASINQEAGDKLWARYLAITQLAVIAVMVFLVAPLVVAPVFLYSWTGEMGYFGRWVFVALAIGAAGSVLALPAAAMAQAAGRADLQAKSAVVSLVLNVPLSYLLLKYWGLAGVAAGTAIAMLVGSSLLLFDVHRAYRQPFASTLRSLWRYWPLVAICVGLAALVHPLFDAWLHTLPRDVRYSWQMRVVPGLVSGGIYAACLLVMAAVHVHRGGLGNEQIEVLSRFIRFKWFVAYCQRKCRPQEHPGH